MDRHSSTGIPGSIFLAAAVFALPADVSQHAIAVAVRTRPAEPSTDKHKLKGTWVLEAVRDGHIDAKDLKADQWLKEWKNLRLTFSGDRVVIQSAGQTKAIAQPYKLIPSKGPKQLDIGRGPSRKEYIYKFQGDQLIMAFALGWELVAGGTFAERQRIIGRPRDFKETKETAAPIIWVLKRVKR